MHESFNHPDCVCVPGQPVDACSIHGLLIPWDTKEIA